MLTDDMQFQDRRTREKCAFLSYVPPISRIFWSILSPRAEGFRYRVAALSAPSMVSLFYESTTVKPYWCTLCHGVLVCPACISTAVIVLSIPPRITLAVPCFLHVYDRPNWFISLSFKKNTRMICTFCVWFIAACTRTGVTLKCLKITISGMQNGRKSHQVKPICRVRYVLQNIATCNRCILLVTWLCAILFASNPPLL